MADPDGERPVIDLLYGSSTLLPTFPKHRKAAGRNSSLRRGLDAEQLAEERERMQREEEKHKNREERIKLQLLEEEQEKGREDEHEGAKEEQKEELAHDDDHHEGAVFPIDSFGRDGSAHGDGEIIEQPQRSHTSVEGSATIITTPPPIDPPIAAPIVQSTTSPQEVEKEELNGNEKSSEGTEDNERTKTSDSVELNLNILQPIAPPAHPQEQRPPSPRGPPPAQGTHQRYSSLTTPQPDPSSPASPALTYSVRTSAPPSPNSNKNSNLLNVHPLHSSQNDFRVPAADGNNNRRQHKRNNSANVVDEKAAEKLKQELLTLRDPKHKIKSYHDRYPLLEDKPKPRSAGGHSPSPSSSTSSYGSYSSSGEPCLSCSLF